jgi:hypothetical protein
LAPPFSKVDFQRLGGEKCIEDGCGILYIFFIYNIECFYLQYRMSECYICLQCLDNTKEMYTLSPCNHEFHAGCLIDWFRIRSTTECPCCENDVNYYKEYLNFLDDFYLDQENQLLVGPVDFAHASRCARKKDAPKALKRLYASYQGLFLKQKQNSKDMRIFQLEHGKDYSLLRKKKCGLRRKRCILNRKIKRVKKSLLIAFKKSEQN